MIRKLILFLFAAGVLTLHPVWAASYYTVKVEDPSAIYLTAGQFGVRGDGVADDTDAIQAAINRVQETTRQGIVFVPEGRYRVSRTIYVWPAIRLIGYGARRPVFVLGHNTPGYQDKSSENYVVFFPGSRPDRSARANERPPDANPGTFYSAMSNIDIEISEGNPGAVGVRGTYAQHAFLAHMDFRLRSGIASVHHSGNVMEDVKFYGGDYGLWSRKPSPGWQLTLVDAEFEGQREAAIRDENAGLTLIRPQFRHVPTAISIDPAQPDQLWIKDATLDDISGPAFVVGLEKNPRTQINMENVVCRKVATFAAFRESGKKLSAPSNVYRVTTFAHGLSYAEIASAGEVKTVFDSTSLAQMPSPFASDLLPLPAGDTWVNIRELGAKGDGATDDTAVFRSAIEKHKTIYLPSGHYVVSDMLALRPDTVLIGLHPSTTQILLLDRTPAFQGIGNAKAVIEAPRGGHNIMIGIGVYTNGINPRATAVKWMAGSDSLMNDVRFLGGHGTNSQDGKRENPYNNNRTADPNLERRWDAQYPSLWVTNGGGGTFFDIWTPSTFAQAGMLVSDTSTEGRVYEMSSEHHVRYEVQLHNVSNWSIYALQTEEERGESGMALPLEIDNSSNITIANLYMYRVISSYQPFPWAVKVSRSRDIRFRNVHSFSNSKVSFDTTIFDQTNKAELRQREFASLTISGVAPAARKPGAIPQKLAAGFFNASGGAVAPNGDFFFVDSQSHRIYRWDESRRHLTTVRDAPLYPVNLAFDKSGNLLVISYSGNGTVYSFKPEDAGDEITMLHAQAAVPRPGLTAVLPVSDWALQRNDETRQPLPRTHQFVSPDGTTFISATEGFMNGATSWGVKSSDLLRAFGLSPVRAGKPFYITSESEITTWSATVGPDGNLQNVKLFANEGGEGVTTDAQGNVYIVAGQVHVYTPSGHLIESIDVPERPLQAAFGGKDGRTLFILGRTSLYALPDFRVGVADSSTAH